MRAESVMLTQVNHATNTSKAYKVDLKFGPGGWSVTAYNGRIGSALKEQPKLTDVGYDQAKKAFDDLVKSKVKSGYVPDDSADVEMVSSIGAEGRAVNADLVPMRPTPISDREFLRLKPSEWMIQEKHDGESRPISIGKEIVATNRQGQAVPVRAALLDQLRILGDMTGEVVIDCEDMGDAGVVIFDVRSGFGVAEASIFSHRNDRLNEMARLATEANLDMIMCEVAIPMEAFLDLDGEENLRRALAEGFVAKRANGVYSPGRANSAAKADSVKLKFTEDATFRVAPSRAAEKRSVGIESLNLETGEWEARGNVTVPADAAFPSVGDLIDVNYLYVVGERGSLVQPVFKRPRPDAIDADCDSSRLKLKRGSSIADPDNGPDGPSI